MKSLNKFFFPELEDGEDLSYHDAGWFYGTLSGAIILTLFIVWVTH